MAQLSTAALIRVLETLDIGLQKLQCSEPDSIDYELFRNSSIKSFELSVEISGKLLRKCLKAFNTDSRAVDSLVFNDVLRQAGKHGLLSREELERWLGYRQQRNATAHDYGEKLAEKAIVVLRNFVIDGKYLSERMQRIFDAESNG